MSITNDTAPIKGLDKLYIGGEWVQPSSSDTISVIEPATEQVYFTVPEAKDADVARAVEAARTAFDEGPWPRLSHTERADYLKKIARELEAREADINQVWPRESGITIGAAQAMSGGVPPAYDFYAGLAETFPFEEAATPSDGQGVAMIAREPVGVIGAIIPWNAPMLLIAYKVAPALLAGCTVVLKASPEAPGAPYIMAEIAEKVGLPPGVLNVLTADREVSESLVRDPRVDKIAFTGSTAAGRKIASIMGERIGRYTLELGGKSAAVVLNDADFDKTAMTLAGAECLLSGQVCSSLTRIIVPRSHHDAFVDALSQTFSQVRLGDPFDENSQMGPLAMQRQRDRVEGYIEIGKSEAKLVTGGGRPKDLERGWFVEPTVFADVDNSSRIAQEEIFGPVLSVIPADDEDHAVRIANDTIYGLNASVFTEDVDRARHFAGRIRSGTVGHNSFRTDFGVGFGGFKQSGTGREGGRDGLLPYLENKSIFLDRECTGFPTYRP